MKSDPWLTLVTVVKDDGEGLQRTLKSLRAQDLTGVEYVVIDSSADRAEVDMLVRVSSVPATIHWTEPAGVYSAMNAGLAQASGAYLYFLNSGDELAEGDVIGLMRSVVEATGPDWLYGDVEIVGTDGAVVVPPAWDYDSERESAFSRGHFPAHQGTLARTEVLRSCGGFDETYTVVADYAMFLRLSRVAPPIRINAVLSRFHEGGISTTRWARSLLEFHRARRQILAPQGRVARTELLWTARQMVGMAVHRSPWPLVVTLLALVFAVMSVTGVAWSESLLLTGLVAIQGLGGALWWRMLRPQREVPILEAVGMGLGLGTAASMLTGLVGAWWWATALAVLAWFPVKRYRPIARLSPLTRPDVLALAVGLVPGIVAFGIAIRSYPLTWSGLWTGYHSDMVFFEAFAASVAKLGPGASIFMEGADLRYHTFAYGWAGQLTQAVDAESFVVLTRLLPLVTLVAATAITASWTRRLTSVWWAPALAVALVVTGGFVGATYGNVLNFDSPSQSMGAVWLLALSPLLLQSLHRVSLTWHIIAVMALVAALTGGKISTAAIAACGFAAIVLVGFSRRAEWRWRALAVASAAAATLIAVYLFLLAGSANAGGLGLLTLLDRASSLQGLNPVNTPKGIAAGVLILIVAALPRWAGVAWIVGDRNTRWSPEAAYGVGLAAGGIATIVILSGGFNDLWFAVAASAPLAVLSSVGAAAAVAWLGPHARGRAVLAACLGLVLSVVVTALWTTGSTGMIGDGWRWVGPLGGATLALVGGSLLARGVERPATRCTAALTIVILIMMALPARLLYAAAAPFARQTEGTQSATLFSEKIEFLPTIDQYESLGWTDTQAEAGVWLRENADSDDIVATNMTLGGVVPALSRLATYVSGIYIQAPYGRVGDLPLIREREAESWGFIGQPSAETVAPLCRSGVDWVWLDPRRVSTSDWSPYATIAHSASDVVVLRLNRAACQ